MLNLDRLLEYPGARGGRRSLPWCSPSASPRRSSARPTRDRPRLPPTRCPTTRTGSWTSATAVPSVRGLVDPRRAEILRGPRSIVRPRHTPEPGPARRGRHCRGGERRPLLTTADGFLVKQPDPLTVAATRQRKDVIVYTVEEGDNVSTLAEKFDVTTDSIVWANGDLEADPDFIAIGQKLNILPIPGVLHTVKAGDTVESVAKTYKADAQDIIEYGWNKLTAALHADRRAKDHRARRRKALQPARGDPARRPAGDGGRPQGPGPLRLAHPGLHHQPLWRGRPPRTGHRGLHRRADLRLRRRRGGLLRLAWAATASASSSTTATATRACTAT